MADIRSALVAWVSELLQSIPAAGLQRCLFDVLWQTTAIGLATVAVLLVFRGRASVRAWLALLGVLLCVIAPIATLCVRAGNWGQRPVLVNVEAPAEVLVAAQMPSVAELTEQFELTPPAADFGELPVVEPPPFADLAEVGLPEIEVPTVTIEEPRPTASATELSEPRPTASAAVTWSLVAGWGALSLACLVRLGRSAWLLRRLNRLARPCDDAEIQQVIARAAEKVGLRRAPAIAISASVDSPAIIAWGRGRLLLPETQPEGTDLFAVACHELAHLQRGDGWSRLAVEIVCALVPWQPLLWRLRSAFRRDCEEACDDWVVALGTDPVELAATLANWLRPAPATLALGMSESVAVTRRRILRLLAQQKRPKARLGRLWLAAGLIIALSCGAGMAFWQTPEPPSEAPTLLDTESTPPSVVPVEDVPELPLEPPSDLPLAEPADEPALPDDAQLPLPTEPKGEEPATESSQISELRAKQKRIVQMKAEMNFDQAAANAELANLLQRLQQQIGKLVNKNIEILELQKALTLASGGPEPGPEIEKKLQENKIYLDKIRVREGYLDELRSASPLVDKNAPLVKRLRAKIEILDSEIEDLRHELIPDIRRSLSPDREASATAVLEAAREAAKMLQDEVAKLETQVEDLKEQLDAHHQTREDGDRERFNRQLEELDALKAANDSLRGQASNLGLTKGERAKLRDQLQAAETSQIKLQQQLLASAVRLLNADLDRGRTKTATSKANVPVENQPYRIAPPDVLLIDSLNLTRSDPKIVRGDKLQIEVSGTPPDQPISGMFKVDSRGRVTFGTSYGVVEVAGLDADQAAAKIKTHLESIIIEPSVSVEVAESTPQQKIAGEHLVGPDGRVNLGVYGNVALAGATLDEAQSAIEEHLKKKGYDATISVSVMSYNSRVYYVIVERDVEVIKGHYSELQTSVLRFPLTGNETALDALSQGNVRLAGKAKVTLARPKPDGGESRLDVDWKSIVAGDSTKTNYRLQSGDRLYVNEQGEAKQVEKPQGVEYFVPTDVK